MHMRVFPADVYTTYVPGTQGSQKQASDSLKLELQMGVNHHVGPGNRL